MFQVAGLNALPATNAVLPGLQATGGRIAARTLLVAPGCIETVREIQTYCWRTRPDGTVRADEPEKLNDHAMDALRYGVMGLHTRPFQPAVTTLRLVEPVRI
jgi:hypothetical protein